MKFRVARGQVSAQLPDGCLNVSEVALARSRLLQEALESCGDEGEFMFDMPPEGLSAWLDIVEQLGQGRENDNIPTQAIIQGLVVRFDTSDVMNLRYICVFNHAGSGGGVSAGLCSPQVHLLQQSLGSPSCPMYIVLAGTSPNLRQAPACNTDVPCMALPVCLLLVVGLTACHSGH